MERTSPLQKAYATYQVGSVVPNAPSVETNKRRIALLEQMAEELYREWFVRLRFPGHQKIKFVKGLPEGRGVKRFGEFCMLKRGYDLPNALVEDGHILSLLRPR